MSQLSSAARTFRASISLLASRRFGTFWFASFLSNIGTWAQQVAEPWLLLSLGASAGLIGLDSFAMNAPVWLLTLAGGVLADRNDRRRVIALFQSIQMLCPTAIVALIATGGVTPAIIIALSLVVGVTDALSMPSFQSIVPTIVAQARIGQGLALNATQFNLSRILGPAIAGLLMARVGALACFALSAASYVPFIGVALWILPPGAVHPRRAGAVEDESPVREFAEILRRPGPRGALLTVAATGFFCGPLVTFVPVLVRDAFQGGAGAYSLAVAAFGVGGLLGGLALLTVPERSDRRPWASRLAVVYGLTMTLIALSPWLGGVLALMAVAGAAMTMSNTAANTLLQSSSDPALLGRTVSLYMLAVRGALPLGALLTGLAIERFGARQTLALDGALAIAAQVTIARAWRRDGGE